MRRRVQQPSYPVKTWCRVCGVPALVEVRGVYDNVVRFAYRLDEAVMEHHNHDEQGSWGVHWRLDEVLALVFPNDHREELWPKMPWYTHCKSENQKVVIASDDEEFLDLRRKELVAQVNSYPKGRRELEDLGMDIWDTKQMGQDFEVLGFRAPFVIVERRCDGARGSLMFQNDPRFYFEFERDRVL
jgi:hypothetical protein